MTRMMNEMMELALISNLRIQIGRVQVKEDDEMKMRVVVENTSPFHVQFLQMTPTLYADGDSEQPIDVEFKVHERTIGGELVDDLSLPISLPPNTRWAECYTLNLPQLVKYNGVVMVTLPSPGTGKPLSTQSSFSITVLDQLRKRYHKPTDVVPQLDLVLYQKEKFDMTLFRDIFHVSPLLGLTLHDAFELSHRGRLFARFELVEFSVHDAICSVEVDSSVSTQQIKALLEEVRELTV